MEALQFGKGTIKKTSLWTTWTITKPRGYAPMSQHTFKAHTSVCGLHSKSLRAADLRNDMLKKNYSLDTFKKC